MERIKHHTLKTLTVGAAILLAFSLSAMAVLNSGALDQFAKHQAVRLFAEKFFGRLEVQDVTLKFPNNITLVHPRLYGIGEKRAAIEAETISMKLNILSLLQPELTALYVRQISADNLNAQLIRQHNGKLNLERLFTRRDIDSTKTPFEKFFCKSIIIKNSAISYVDNSAAQAGVPLNVQQINLELSKFTVKKRLLKGTLEQLQCTIPQYNVALHNASGQFHFSDTRSELLVLTIETNKSHAKLSASLDRFNIFSPERAQTVLKSSSFINIEEISLHSDDAKLLFPTVSLPNGFYTLKGNVKGKNEVLDILETRLTHLKSRLAVKGKLLNLTNSNAFAYDIICDSSKISVPLLESLLKNEAHKALARKTKGVNFLGTAKGTLNAIKGDATIITAAGELSLSGETAKEPSGQLAGKGTIALKKITPHTFFDAANSKSLINATGTLAAKSDGKEISEANIDLKLSNSFWQNQPVQQGTVLLNYTKQTLQGKIVLENNQSSAAVEGDIAWKSGVPTYQVSGKTAKLNLADIFPSHVPTTDLSGSFTLQGSGFDPKKLNISSELQFEPSLLNGFAIKDKTKIAIEIVQHDAYSRTNINSDFVDLLAEGAYSFNDLLNLGSFASAGIAQEIATQNIWSSDESAPAVTAHRLDKPFTVNYRIKVKDISPLTLLWPMNGITVQGKAEGQASYQEGQCTINAIIDAANVRAEGVMAAQQLAMELGLTCTDLGVQHASIAGKAKSITIATTEANNALFSGIYSPSHLEGSVDLAIADPAKSIAAKVAGTKNGNSYNVLVKQFAVKDAAGVWQTAANSTIVIGATSANFNHLSIAKGGQQIVVDGELSNAVPGTFSCTLRDIDINELKQLGANSTILNKLSGTIDAALSVSGEPDAKTSAFTIKGDNLRYNDFALGSLISTGTHRGNQLRFELRSNVPSTNKGINDSANSTIAGGGTIPLSLSYFPLKWKIIDQQPVSASFTSDNLPAEFITLVFPLFSAIEGVLPTTLRVQGNMPQPEIVMTTHLRNTIATIAPTQVTYRLNGDLAITPHAIELRNITINDSNKGNGTISGLVYLEELKPKTLALTAVINRLLLFNKEDNGDDTSYGTIIGTTNNIAMRGSLSAPIIEGEMRIDAADFTLYRSGANESTKYVGSDKFLTFVPRNKSIAKVNSDVEEKPTKATEFYHSLLDILQIHQLKLTSIEPLKYSMIFDSNRGEALETSINNLSLVVNKNNQNYRLFGSVNIIGGKYKFSNTNFDLQDGAQMRWNNVDIRSGTLENLYGSKFVSTTNVQSGQRDNVNLLLAITGTLNTPQVSMGYYLNEESQPYARDNTIGKHTSQIDPNAELNVISMLLAKQWYIKPGSKSENSNLAVSSAGFSAGTGILSSRISKLIQGIGGIESFNVNVGVDNKGELSGLDLYVAMSVPGTNGKVRFIGTGNSPNLSSSAFTDYYGTSQKLEYRITPKIYVEALRSFGQSGNNNVSSNLQKPTETWGLSLSYKEQFQSWSEFWKRLTPSSDNNDPKK